MVKRTRVIQYALAAVLISTGCLAVYCYEHVPFPLSFCFYLPGVALFNSKKYPFSQKERWFIISLVAGMIIAGILCFNLMTKSAADRMGRSPAFLIPAWTLMMLMLYWRWRSEKKFIEQNPENI